MLTSMVFAVVVAAVAAIYDLRSGLIPNWLTLGALALGIGGHFVRGLVVGGIGPAGLEAATSLAGALFCALVPGVMYWKNGMGGGDLKLFAGLGALCQPMLGIELELYAFALTALVVPARLAYEGRLLKVLGGSLALVANPFLPVAKRRVIATDAGSWVRLGPAVFGAAVLTLIVHRVAGNSSYFG